ALARLGEFGGRTEAWETLAHELRHHLEWRAHVSRLEAYDWAAEENFRRHEGQPFDPLFYRSGESVEDGVWKVDDDVFVALDGARGTEIEIPWHGRAYRVAVLEIEPAGSMDRIAALVARGTPVLAYGSHVQADLLRAARDAGAAAVPNSQVEERLRELLGTADGGLPG